MRFVNIELPLAGVDQYSDAAYVLRGQKLDTVQNLRMRSPPKLQARHPMTEFGSTTIDGSTIGTPYAIVGHLHETLIGNDNTLYALDAVSGSWASKGNLSECHVSRFPAYSDFSGSVPQDAACGHNQGITVLAWSGADDGINAVVVDAATDTVVGVAQFSGGGSGDRLIAPRVVAVGDYLYILTQPAAGAGIEYTRIDVTSGNYTFAAPAGLTPTGTASTSVAFDACPWSSTQFLIAYWDSGAGRIYVDQISTTAHGVDATRNNTKTTCTALGVCQASSTLGFVAFCGTGGVSAGLEYAAFDNALSTTGGPAQLTSTTTCFSVGLAATSSTRAMAVWEMPAAGGARAYAQWRDFTSGALGSTQQWTDVVPISKPLLNGTRCYALFVNNSDETRSGIAARQESSYFLGQVGTTTATTEGRLAGYACRARARPNVAQGYLHSWASNGTQHDIGLGLLTQFRAAKDDDGDKLLARNAMTRTRFDFDPSNLHSSAEWAHGRLFAGACPRWYDGISASEHGFPWGPEWDPSAVAVAAGSTLEVGVYQVASTYEYEDAGGYVARSLPSPYYEMTTTLGNEVIQVTHDHECDLAAKPSAVRVRHWKTVVDATEPLYSAQQSDLGASVAFGTVATLDQTDADAPSGEVLYITGDILDNGPTPPCKVAVRHGDRIYLAGLEDAELVAFSQPFVAGEQPRFNEALALRFPEPVTALASMDQTLVVFTRAGVFLVSGEGPPATGGLDAGFSITTVSRVIGTDQPRSVLVTPKGVMFLSARGFYSLDRGFGLAWVGAAVTDSTATYSVCSGAAVDPYHPEAVFWLRNSGSSGIRAVYYFDLDQWVTDTHPSATCAFGGGVAWSDTLSKWTLVQVMSDGALAYDAQAYPPVEGNDYIDTQIVTPWVALNTVQGWQRVRKLMVLADFTGVSTGVSLLVQVGYDHDPAWFESHSFTGTELEALGKPAYAYITVPAGSSLIDGETFTFWDGATNTTFEFDDNASITPGNVAVSFTAADTPQVVRDAVLAAVGLSGANVSVSAVAGNRLLLVCNVAGTSGNAASSDTVASADFVIDNMSFGAPLDQVELHTSKQECEAVRFRLRVTGSADDGGNVDFRSLVMEAGVQPRTTMQLNTDTARD